MRNRRQRGNQEQSQITAGEIGGHRNQEASTQNYQPGRWGVHPGPWSECVHAHSLSARSLVHLHLMHTHTHTHTFHPALDKSGNFFPLRVMNKLK